MRIGLFGAGRLGSAVRDAAREAGHEIAWILSAPGDPPSIPEAALDAGPAAGVAGHLAWARRSGCPLVIGATGWDRSLISGAEDWGVGIMVAPNFSLGVAFMRRAALALGRFAALEGSRGVADLALLERHHRGKADAPSGTAKLLAEALVVGNRAGGGAFDGWCSGAAREGKVNLASLRAGAEVGYHELRIETGAETLVLSHQAHSRAVFASGALRALEWMRGRKGLHSFDELAATLIDPLFANGGI